MLRFFLIIFAIPLMASFASAHGNHDHGNDEGLIESLYENIIESFQNLPANPVTPKTDIVYLKYGTESIALRHSAFSNFVEQAIKAQSLESHLQCSSCTGDHKEQVKWTKKIRRFAKLKTIEISAFAYKGLKQYGIPYAVFFLIFEATEHSIFAWLPPLCPVYHAAYFAAYDFFRKVKLLATSNTGISFSERARVVANSRY